MIKAEADKSIQKHVSMLKEKESKIGDLEGTLLSRDEQIAALLAMRDQEAAEVMRLRELAESVPLLKQQLGEVGAVHHDVAQQQQELAGLRETEAGLRGEVARLQNLLDKAHSDMQSVSTQVSRTLPSPLAFIFNTPLPPSFSTILSLNTLCRFSIMPRSASCLITSYNLLISIMPRPTSADHHLVVL